MTEVIISFLSGASLMLTILTRIRLEKVKTEFEEHKRSWTEHGNGLY